MANDTSEPGVRPASEIPRPGLLRSLQMIASGGGGRVDMLTPLRRLHAQHGPVVMQKAGAFRMVNLFGPDANRFVLVDQDRIFSAKKPWDMIMGRIFPNGLLLRDGEDHKHHRKIMHTAFTRPALRTYAARMGPMIESHLETWGERGGKLSAFAAYKALTLDMASSIFVGVDLGVGTATMNRAFEAMVAASMSRIRLPIPGLEFQRGLAGRAWLISFFRDLLPKRRAAESADMLARLCRAETEEGHRFADQEIIDHMIFLMMAAHDTTTSTLSSMTYELAQHPAWQERVREECRALGSAPPSFEDLERLTTIDMVLKETLRRYPPLPVIPRVATEEFSFGGYRIPARSMVVVSPIHTHHMEEWWDDPFRFDPERFAEDRAEFAGHTHRWVPFGGGGHHCIGFRFAETQVKLVMHQLVQRYRWSVPAGYRMPVQQAPISKPRDGLPIRIERL
jgi:cytochrome P450